MAGIPDVENSGLREIARLFLEAFPWLDPCGGKSDFVASPGGFVMRPGPGIEILAEETAILGARVSVGLSERTPVHPIRAGRFMDVKTCDPQDVIGAASWIVKTVLGSGEAKRPSFRHAVLSGPVSIPPTGPGVAGSGLSVPAGREIVVSPSANAVTVVDVGWNLPGALWLHCDTRPFLGFSFPGPGAPGLDLSVAGMALAARALAARTKA